LQILEFVKTVSYNQKVNLKVGVHYGRIIAGVIGLHKPQFSLIGDTINTTSRVTSTSEENRLTVSE